MPTPPSPVRGSMGSTLRILSDLTSFAVLLLAARIAEWTPGELAWGLWVAGFAMVVTWLLILTVLLIREDGVGVTRTGGVLVAAAIFAWGLVWIYRFYGEMLDFAFPLIPDPGRVHVGGTTWRHVRRFELWPNLVAGLRQLWVVVGVSLLPLVPGLLRGWPDAAKFRLDPGFRPGAFGRLHFTVMALAALQIVFRDDPGAHTFAFSAAILTINYFPWSLLGSSRPGA